MQTLLIKLAIERIIKAIAKRSRGKLTYASVGALVVGLVSELLGVDIAPDEVDALLTFAATAGALYGRWRATWAAK